MWRRCGGKQVVLWVDDLHEFKRPDDVTALSDLPRRLGEAGVRFVVVVTCRDGSDYDEAKKLYGSLLERLYCLPLHDIDKKDAITLAVQLAKEKVEVHGDEFDGTPGSLVFGLERMHGRYLRLGEVPKVVLKTMKLLRSAGILCIRRSVCVGWRRMCLGWIDVSGGMRKRR